MHTYKITELVKDGCANAFLIEIDSCLDRIRLGSLEARKFVVFHILLNESGANLRFSVDQFDVKSNIKKFKYEFVDLPAQIEALPEVFFDRIPIGTTFTTNDISLD